MKKTPSDGFYHASRAEHTYAAEERERLDYWIERRVGHDPKIGNRELDNTIERQRSQADLDRILAGTRKRYPRAFGINKPEWSDDRKPIPYVESPPELVAERMAKLEAKLVDAQPRMERDE